MLNLPNCESKTVLYLGTMFWAEFKKVITKAISYTARTEPPIHIMSEG